MFADERLRKIFATLFIAIIVILGYFADSCLAKPQIAVLGLNNNTESDISHTLEEISRDLLSAALVNGGYFTVVERARLEEIIEEQKLTLTGLLAQENSAVSVGKLLGVEYLLAGSLNSFYVSIEPLSSYGLEFQVVDASATGILHLINVTTGAIEKTSPFAGSYQENLGAKAEVSETMILGKILRPSFEKVIPLFNFEPKLATTEEASDVFVQIYSTPSGSEVFIDSRKVGVTPIDLYLPSRMHEVMIKSPGFSPWIREIVAFEGLQINAILDR